MLFSRFNLCLSQRNEVFIYSTLSECLVSVTPEVYDVLSAQSLETIHSILTTEQIAFLSENKILADDKQEINELIEHLLNLRFDQSLELMIHTTLQCNLKCPYCFQNSVFKETMTGDKGDEIISFLQKRMDEHPFSQMFITWTGGEPLLVPDIIATTTAKIRDFFPSVKLQMKLITNGTLITDEILKTVFQAGITTIQITIDGLLFKHNSRRSGQNSDTFTTILQNIDYILSSCPSIHLALRMNIDRSNRKDYIPLHLYLQNKFSGKNYSLTPAFVHDYNFSGMENLLNREEQREFYLNLCQNSAISGFDIHAIFHRPTSGCLRLRHNSYSIGPDGKIYSCEVEVGNKTESIGDIAHFFSPDKQKIQLSDNCLICSLLPICNWGCTKRTLGPQGNRCHIIKGHEQTFLNALIQSI